MDIDYPFKSVDEEEKKETCLDDPEYSSYIVQTMFP